MNIRITNTLTDTVTAPLADARLRPNWRHVAVFLGLTFGLTWLLCRPAILTIRLTRSWWAARQNYAICCARRARTSARVVTADAATPSAV
jgi:hypothetical protein